MTPCNTNISVASPQDELFKNDNSNPQQGTGPQPLTTTMEQITSPPEGQTKPSSDGANTTTNNRLNTMRSPPTKKDSRKLFVGGLPADVTEEEFRVFFEQFGEVVDSVVMFDRETHRSRGFGFVTYQSSDVANRLLNMGQGEGEGENGAGKLEDTKTPRVGRLVMRGKTCEVKAAEPKESSRSNRRGYQNQGGSSGTVPARRYVEKAYPQQSAHTQSAPHMNPYHEHHYMGGSHYPMVNPSYYPAYHPGMYHHGAAGYHATPMYAPVAHNQVHGDGIHLPYMQPVLATPFEGVHGAPHMEGAQEHGQALTAAAAYGHAHMMHHAYHHAMHPQAPKPTHPQAMAAYPAPGTPSSAMHPAAPGLPNKEE